MAADRPTPTGPAAPDLRIVESRVYRGGNIWSYDPAIHLVVDLGVLEGYPTEPTPGKTVIWDEASVGLLQVFIDAGYEVEASPTLRRRVVRHRLGATS